MASVRSDFKRGIPFFLTVKKRPLLYMSFSYLCSTSHPTRRPREDRHRFRSPDLARRYVNRLRVSLPISKRTATTASLLMEHFGVKKFSVVGHDRGGRVGHRMALDYPDRMTCCIGSAMKLPPLFITGSS